MSQELSLERIAIALEQLLASRQEKVQLGLSTESQRKWLYVGQESGACWYFRRNDQNIPVEETCLTGFIKSIEVVQKEYKGRSNYKLQITVNANIKYVLQSGLDTIFSRGVLLALNLLTESELREPISIGVKPGNQESIVLGSIAQNGEVIKAHWDESIDLHFIAGQIQSRLGQSQVISADSQPAIDQSLAPSLNLTENRRILFEQTNAQIAKLKWTATQGKEFLQANYNGKVVRSQLTDEELADFTKKLDLLIRTLG